MFPTIYNDFPSKSCDFYIPGLIRELLKPLQNMTYQYCTDKNVGFSRDNSGMFSILFNV